MNEQISLGNGLILKLRKINLISTEKMRVKKSEKQQSHS